MNDLQPFKQNGPFQVEVLAPFFAIIGIASAIIGLLFLYLSIVGLLSPHVFASPIIPIGLPFLTIAAALMARFSLHLFMRVRRKKPE